MDNFTHLQNEFMKFYKAVATAEVLKEEYARQQAMTSGKDYNIILEELDSKIKEKHRQLSSLSQEP